MSGSFTQVFGGNTIYPSDVSYLALTLDADTTLEWPQDSNGANVVARIIDVTPAGPYTITLSNAQSVSVGTTILFNNLGPSTITVDKADGNAILSIGPGEQWQTYLTDNNSVGGTWRSFRYGAATAQAQASALAGPGLLASGSALAQNYPVTEFSTTPYSLTAPDRAKAFVWTDGLGTLNLPTATTVGNGWFVQIRNAGQGDLTIDPAGSETVNDGPTLVLQPGDSAVLVSTGTEWFTIGLGQQPVFAFDYTSIAVTGGTYTLAGSELNRIAYKFTGTLTSNVTIVVPATVQQYWVNNATTGAYTLSLRAAGSGSSTAVTQGETAILYCDGSAIISATTSSPFAGVLPIAQGGTGATSAASARTNLGATGIGDGVFTAATTAAARSSIAAAASGANSDITSLTGLTTPLSVAQGGTGSGTASGARANLGAAASGANTDITGLSPAGGLTVGAPTGGAQGAGTINATGLFINGVGVGTGSGSVTSVNVSGGTTGLTTSGGPVTTSGTITLAGTLAVANGGTGQTSYTNGQLLIGNSTGNTLTKATLTAGSGITITNGNGSITIASTAGGGTVTSVAASGGTTGLSFTGSPITTSGTLTLDGTLVIANGGTGATSASGARLNLGAAASGANSDITSLTGLTTALSVAQGGTGATSASAARSALGAAASGANNDITSLTGLTTALSVGQGGTGSTTASGARTNLGATTVGGNLFTLANPTAVTFLRVNADNTVSTLDAATFRSAIGAGTGNGTVTSVGGTGTVNGLTLTGTVTGSGNLTLGGTLSGVSLATQVTGTLPVGNGGTGATTLTGVVIGNGASAFTTVTAPSGAIVGTTDTQNLTNKTLTTGNTLDAGTSVSDTGTIAAASPGFRGLPQVAITANHTLALTNAGKEIYISGTTAAQTVTIPANGTTAFPVGTIIQITNDSNQNWSIAITTDTLLWSPNNTTGTRTLAAAGQATIRKVTSTRWWISGVGLT